MRLYRDFASQEEIDREYDVESAVPDFPRYADVFVTESERARRELDAVLDVPFGPTRAEHLDIYPAAEPGAPVFVFIHGGYWRILSSKEFALVARGPVARGATVVVTNYALCPAVTISEITRQSRAAIAWIRHNIERYNGDPERVVVAGHSAGGQQVARLLATDWEGDYALPGDVVKAGIAISGVFDLRPLPHSWLAPKLRLDHDTVMRESPQLDVRPCPSPLVVTVGGDETPEFLRQSADYLAAWRAAGNDGRDFAQPGLNHFTAIEGYCHADSPLTAMTLDLIAETAPARAGTPAEIDEGPGEAPAEPAHRPAARPAPRFPTFGVRKPSLSFERRSR
ncbi:MAG: alpha/beta hydrolase [Azospirillaceae bacterium]